MLSRAGVDHPGKAAGTLLTYVHLYPPLPPPPLPDPHPNIQIEVSRGDHKIQVRKLYSGPPKVVCPGNQDGLGGMRVLYLGMLLGRFLFPESADSLKLSTNGCILFIPGLVYVQEHPPELEYGGGGEGGTPKPYSTMAMILHYRTPYWIIIVSGMP